MVGRVLLGHSYFRQDDALLMLRELFGNRAAILVPFTVYLFSPLWLWPGWPGGRWLSRTVSYRHASPEIICLIALGLAAALILPGP